MSLKCDLCTEMKEGSEMIVLSCTHTFCWSCIEDYLKKILKNKTVCPVSSCKIFIKDREIRKILPEEDIQKYENLCIKQVPNMHICILPECGFPSTYEYVDIQFDCPNCTVYNCVQCRLAHKSMSCGDTASRNGESLDLVCQRELERARVILSENMAKSFRSNIVNCDKMILLPNPTIFTCDLCYKDIEKKKGVMLRNCFHKICRNCLKEYVKNNSSFPIACPFSPCKSFVEDRECRELLSTDDVEIYENKSLTRASRSLEHADHCRQYNCKYLCDLDKKVRSWICLNCKSLNCVDCNTIHVNQTCQEYKNVKVLTKDDINIEKLILEKKLMRCLECQTIIQKTGGCNWISCSNCGVELCWINQMYRWGPKGPGDTSAGCKCFVNGIFCHPDCRGCIPDRARRHSRYAGLSEGILDFDFGRSLFSRLMLNPQSRERESLMSRQEYQRRNIDISEGRASNNNFRSVIRPGTSLQNSRIRTSAFTRTALSNNLQNSSSNVQISMPLTEQNPLGNTSNDPLTNTRR